jgi:hypothetical protein
VEAKDLLPVIFPTAVAEATGKLECSCESAEAGRPTSSSPASSRGRARKTPAQITFSVKTGRLTYDFGKKRAASLLLSGSFEATADMLDVVRKPGTGATIGNEEERRKVGEILSQEPQARDRDHDRVAPGQIKEVVLSSFRG